MKLCKHNKTQSGFTLVELLVVIAIIGILIGMLLPAVQQVREAARRATCQNNSKQLGIGLLNYESAFGTFPPGYGFNHPANAGSWRKVWGWGARILPFIEQQNLSDVLDVSSREMEEALPGSNWSSWPPDELKAMQTKIPVFRCPSDDGPDINISADYVSSSVPETHMPATSNFIAVYAYHYSNWYVESEAPPNNNGVFRPQLGTQMSDNQDGTSNTFMLGERGTEHQAGYWVGPGNVNSEASWSSPKVVGRVFLFKPNPPLIDRYYSAFSSNHAGGLNFIFADGSVHFIAESIDFDNGLTTNGQPWAWWHEFEELDPTTFGVYQKLGCRNDHQPTEY